jgi:hypothetical protein
VTGAPTADAHAFFSSDQHQASMRGLYRQRCAYSHFLWLWEMTTPRLGELQSFSVVPMIKII